MQQQHVHQSLKSFTHLVVHSRQQSTWVEGVLRSVQELVLLCTQVPQQELSFLAKALSSFSNSRSSELSTQFPFSSPLPYLSLSIQAQSSFLTILIIGILACWQSLIIMRPICEAPAVWIAAYAFNLSCILSKSPSAVKGLITPLAACSKVTVSTIGMQFVALVTQQSAQVPPWVQRPLHSLILWKDTIFPVKVQVQKPPPDSMTVPDTSNPSVTGYSQVPVYYPTI